MRRSVLCAFTFIGCLFPDLSALDDAANSDAGNGDGAPDAASGFCASQSPVPAFCDDFDESSTVTSSWDNQTLTLGGTLILDQTNSQSPPRSLSATVPGTTNDGYPAAFSTKCVGAAAHDLTLDVDMRVVTTDKAKNGGYALNVGMGGMLIGINLEAGGKATMLVETFPSDGGATTYTNLDDTFTFTFVLGAWTHVQMHVDVSASTLDFVLGGKSQLTAQALPEKVDATSPCVNVGLWYAESDSTGWVVGYDNVLVTTE